VKEYVWYQGMRSVGLVVCFLQAQAFVHTLAFLISVPLHWIYAELSFFVFHFQGFDDLCLGIVALHLRPATFAMGEIIYEHGDRGNEMFFVTDGTVVVHTDRFCSKKTLDQSAASGKPEYEKATEVVSKGIVTKGDVFGEAGLFPEELGLCRRESVSALTWVCAYTLNSAALQEISAEYPEVQPTFLHPSPNLLMCVATFLQTLCLLEWHEYIPLTARGCCLILDREPDRAV
jgi:hypothetical protein